VQTLPQLPQFAESVCSSLHEPLQALAPGWHPTHAPLTHRPDPHAFPQTPQLCGSKATSAHPLLQATSPILQPVQAPLTHSPVPALQLFPHVPQWAGSEDVSTQEPPHAVWPG
jgi:hypothetical protein